MSRKMTRAEVCADCSAPVSDPGWASINRGVLVCDECCSVHRSLGRHISLVKHLRHSQWPTSLIQMVQTLVSNGANSIWEHSLLDPAQIQSGKRKANPHDKVHPTKAEFIKAKYQMLSFVHRMPCREDDNIMATDLSRQLHSSVRTGNLETSLRLLSLGAQANYFNPDKGNTPLHVAAKAGQTLQAELLVVYGADPGAVDALGQTPVECARQAGHTDLADRLVECQYELTDRLTFYLCGRKPDHKSGQHFVIPQMADSSLDLSEFAKAAKKKLEALSNHLFEELAMDVYDEVDRRETDAVWLTTQNHSKLVTDRTAVPFLPVNPEYSSTRNQGRQKLARFNAREFATLIIDILSDAKRRQQGTAPGDSMDDDDVHDYDIVPSEDEDVTPGNSAVKSRAKSMDSDLSDGPITLQEYMEVKSALASSEAKVQRLLKVNSDLGDELRRLRQEVDKLHRENSTLREQLGSGSSPYPGPHGGGGGGSGGGGGGGGGGPSASRKEPVYQVPTNRRPSMRGVGGAGRPQSMCETSSLPRSHQPGGDGDARAPDVSANIRRSAFVTAPVFSPSHHPALFPARDAMRGLASGLDSSLDGDYSSYREVGLGVRCVEGEESEGDPSHALPSGQDVIRKTEQITKNIQELLRSAQECKHESFVPCSSKIHIAVSEMAALFPKKPRSETLRASLRLMTGSALRLQSECMKTIPADAGDAVDLQLITQQVIQCAYDIAKAARQLVTFTTNAANA
ncbi:ARF GTPase-activating protein GIT2 isoform X1 [Lampetra fluviatilis]